MLYFDQLKPESVFRYFQEIAAIPHGSKNMEKITAYCMEFASKHSLNAERDKAGNVIIWKSASPGYETHAPVILQGHLDMVCQKTPESTTDFETDGLELLIDGDYLKARGTTLGADNGIAVAMILSLLADKTISHPPIEAVFTTDEEIGMVGAGQFDFAKLSGKRMINLDAEEQDMLTVSCAGGSDFRVRVPVTRTTKQGTKVQINLSGLQGGHSGVEIHKGRVNGGMLAGRLLCMLEKRSPFSLLELCAGDKTNAIIPSVKFSIVVEDAEYFIKVAKDVLSEIQEEIADREPDFSFSVTGCEEGEYSVLTDESKNEFIYFLSAMPNGVVDMHTTIENLVETSLNLGILNIQETYFMAHFLLRSNKMSALKFLEEKLATISQYHYWEHESFGHYPPWEYKEDSKLQTIYTDVFYEMFGYAPTVTAIHAGLECGIFTSGIPDLECIAIGPWMYDVHTVNERLSISSTQKMYALLLKLLEKL